MSILQRWLETACSELGIEPAAADPRIVLDLARDVAHQVDRPAAPVTAYLLGIAVGRGQPLGATAERLTELAAAWPGSGGGTGPPSSPSSAPPSRPA